MKKILFLSLALMLSVGLWAETQTVSYRYPVYKTDGVATSGIKEWKTDEVTATVVTSSADVANWGTAGNTTWYVVKGANITLSKGAACTGDVRLILADGATLTATGVNGDYDTRNPGVQVSGDGNSLVIYGQAEESGHLIATGGEDFAGIGGRRYKSGSNITINGGIIMATGGSGAAGIGGGWEGSGSNITINGGIVTANGGGDGAGIGGGYSGSGSNITINGGTVTANGGVDGAGIGSGDKGPAASDIFVTTSLVVKADNSEHPSTVIENNGEDLAESLKGKQYATIEPKGTLTAEDFVISNNTATYDGEAKTATVAFKDDITGAGTITVTYKQNGEEVTPINVGTYDIYVSVAEGTNYNAATALTKDDWKFTIELPIGEWITLRTEVTANDWNTICVEHNITEIDGATFWNVVSETEKEFILEQEFAPFAAGVGYIIRYTATELKVKYEGDAVTNPVTATQDHPIQGNFAEITCDEHGTNDLVGNYVVYGNQLCKVTGWVTMADHRAYVVADLAPKQAPAPTGAPRMTMPKPNSTPTGLGQSAITNHKSAMKVIENGQFRIVRDNKMYNAQGIEL